MYREAPDGHERSVRLLLEKRSHELCVLRRRDVFAQIGGKLGYHFGIALSGQLLQKTQQGFVEIAVCEQKIRVVKPKAIIDRRAVDESRLANTPEFRFPVVADRRLDAKRGGLVRHARI